MDSQSKSAERNRFMIRAIAAWSCVPELRFGQFIENVRMDEFARNADLFYIDDDDLIVAMEKWAAHVGTM